jgi:predicted transposase/invertase (TIGR01784 family)
MEIDDDKLHHSHDKLFKAAFQIRQTVIEFLLNFFPKDLVSLINLDELVLDTTNYISSNMKEQLSDVVYRTKLADSEAALVLLFEHKTSIDRSLFLQLLEYMLAIWQKDLAEKKPFTIIIPIVIYHGDTGYTRKPMYHFFPNLPELLRPFVPQFEFILSSIKKIGDVEILDLSDENLLKTLFLAFKHIKNTNFVIENFNEFFKFYEKNKHLKTFFRQFMLYLFSESEMQNEIITELLNQLPNPIKDNIMSTYANIKNAGKVEGKLEGKLEGKIEGKLEAETNKNIQFIEKGFLNGLSVELLSNLTDTTIEYVKSVISKMNKEN